MISFRIVLLFALFYSIIVTAEQCSSNFPIEIIKPKSASGHYQNSAGLLRVPVEIKNNSSLVVKYITIGVYAINEVGDIMSPELGNAGGIIIGPIVPSGSKITECDFDTYYRGAVDKVLIKIEAVEFMDKSVIDCNVDAYISNTSWEKEKPKFTMWALIIGGIVALSAILIVTNISQEE